MLLKRNKSAHYMPIKLGIKMRYVSSGRTAWHWLQSEMSVVKSSKNFERHSLLNWDKKNTYRNFSIYVQSNRRERMYNARDASIYNLEHALEKQLCFGTFRMNDFSTRHKMSHLQVLLQFSVSQVTFNDSSISLCATPCSGWR